MSVTGFYLTTCSDHEEITVICKKLVENQQSRHGHVTISFQFINHVRKNHEKITVKSRRNQEKSWSLIGHDIKFGGKSRSRSRHNVKFTAEEKPWVASLCWDYLLCSTILPRSTAVGKKPFQVGSVPNEANSAQLELGLGLSWSNSVQALFNRADNVYCLWTLPWLGG